MTRFDNRNSENYIHAIVVISQRVIDLMGKELPAHFIRHKVSLLNVTHAESHGPDAITLVLAGKEIDIKRSLNQLRKICEAIETGIEFTPVKSLPPVIKGYLSDMEDDFKFEKIFSYCSKEYLDYCKAHNIKPHPEVEETLKASD